jgi:hypothetical protein
MHRTYQTLVIGSGLLAATASSQQWQLLPLPGPPARHSHAMVYDAGRQVTVLFGGSTGVSLLSDLWEFDGNAWQQRQPAGSALPVARNLHAMAYDEARGSAVLFGGANRSTWLGDTWEWDGAAWSAKSMTGPSPRQGHAMAFDPSRGQVMLCGGDQGGTECWHWDGLTWTQSTAALPLWTFQSALTGDLLRGRVTLFAGSAVFQTHNVLLEWDGNAWLPQAASGPQARLGHAMAYDPAQGLSVLFGGRADPLGFGLLNDTWGWDGNAFGLLAAGGPPARSLHAMVCDRARNRLVLFGGSAQGNATLGDTWEMNLTPARAQTYGQGCGNPPLQLQSDPAAMPVLGTLARAYLLHAPATSCYGILGLSRSASGSVPLPIDLTAFGAPGCWLYNDHALSSTFPLVGSTSAPPALELPLPQLPQLLGSEIEVQTWCAGSTAPSLSNGLTWRLGLP